MRKVLMCGTGEYSTGYIPGSEAAPDKKKGVVGLVLFDLRRRGKLSQVGCVGVNGKKFPEIRKHLQVAIAECYKDMDVTMDTWPGDSEVNPEAYKTAIDSLQKGDGAIIFTPDDTHFDITLYAIKKGIHVLVTKPVVKTVKEHLLLIQAAREHKVHVQIEYHKRWDQIYADARERIRDMGDFTFFQSYMSQPQKQLVTFKAWAGKSSDISYYLNSHHMDWHCWAMDGRAVPTKVTAFGSTGVADAQFGCPNGTEDSISVMAEWQNSSGTKGTAVYTSCWTAPDNAEVHSQQRFMCVAHKGEVRADQAHRGYEVTTDGKYSSVNPLYMKYTKDDEGRYAGQRGYGYISIEAFVDACTELNANKTTLASLNKSLPTIENSLQVTALLEAGRKSLDSNGNVVDVQSLIKETADSIGLSL